MLHHWSLIWVGHRIDIPQNCLVCLKKASLHIKTNDNGLSRNWHVCATNTTCFIAWMWYFDWPHISWRTNLDTWWMHGMTSSRSTCYIQRTTAINIWWAILNGVPLSVYGWIDVGSYIKYVYGCLGVVVQIHNTCFKNASNCTLQIPVHPQLVLYVHKSWLQNRKSNVSWKMLQHSVASIILTSSKMPRNMMTGSEKSNTGDFKERKAEETMAAN